MLRTRENFDVFNSLGEIYLVFTSKKQISSIYSTIDTKLYEHFKNIYHIANFIAYFYFFESKKISLEKKKMIIYIFLLKTLIVGTHYNRLGGNNEYPQSMF